MNIPQLGLSKVVQRAPAPDRDEDIRHLINAFRRRARTFAAIAIGVIAIVMLVSLQLTPRYTATATVMMDTQKHDLASGAEVVSGLPPDSAVVDTEVEILKSRSLTERVVGALGLEKDPEFNRALRPAGGLRGLLSAIGIAPEPVAPPTSVSQIRAHEAVVDEVLKHLSIRRQGVTYVIDISFESLDGAKAARIANAFADKYLLEQLEAKFEATQQANDWLNQRLAELQPQVEQAEAAVQQYKAQHGLLASVGSTLTEQEISNLDSALDQAKADAAEKEARVATAREEASSGATGENLTGPLSSQTMMQLRAQQAAASSKVADLQTKYGPKHPEVQRAERELADINAQISQEVARNVANLQTEDQVARQRVASLQASLSAAKGTLVGNNAASVELADLQRRADAASTLYDSLLARAKQTSIQQSGQQSDARVVSHAKIPVGPSFPNLKLNLALGLVLGIGAGVGVVFLLEMFDSGIATSDEVERAFNLPCLGSVPLLQSTSKSKRAKENPSKELVSNPLSVFSESFRSLKTSIFYSNIDSPVKTVLVTSSLPGEGKTTTTICLGRSMALGGARVVMVDCDLRRRSISRILGDDKGRSLIEVLQGSASVKDALVVDEESGAYFLALHDMPYTPKDLLNSAAMDRLLAELREQFDYVLLDTAPVIPVSDARAVAPKADMTLFVVQWRRTPRKAVKSALALLDTVGADVAGIALTQVDVRSQSKYGYGDAGYYYKRYSSYYAHDVK